MAISTTRLMRADRWHTLRVLAAAVATVSILQIMAPTASMAQGPAPAKSQLRVVHPKAKPHVNPANAVSPTDMEADQLNEKWLSDFNKTDKPAEAPAPATATTAQTPPGPAFQNPATAPAITKAAATTTAPTTTQAVQAPVVAQPNPTQSIAGTESEHTIAAPLQAIVPGAGARALVPGTITYVKADNAAAAFNSMPGGANQPLFKDLNEAFAGFLPGGANAAKVQLIQARTIDGSTHPIYASIGEGKGRKSYWWFSPPDQPEGWFDDQGKRLGGTVLSEPKPGAKISSPFGTRRFYGRVTSTAFHNGIDFEGKTGEPIYAAADGVVNHANWYYNYGRTVKITHADNFETLYAHMSRIAPGITPGVTVHRGDVIGYIGATGRAFGSHLHFSTIVDGKFVDPEHYLSENGGYSTLQAQDLVTYRQWQQDVRAAAVAQAGPQKASFWSHNPFTPPPAPGQL
jgi:murein DD-endopeptidase MepM/ murein hydrolase activator NlpD